MSPERFQSRDVLRRINKLEATQDRDQRRGRERQRDLLTEMDRIASEMRGLQKTVRVLLRIVQSVHIEEYLHQVDAEKEKP